MIRCVYTYSCMYYSITLLVLRKCSSNVANHAADSTSRVRHCSAVENERGRIRQGALDK